MCCYPRHLQLGTAARGLNPKKTGTLRTIVAYAEFVWFYHLGDHYHPCRDKIALDEAP